MKKNLFARIIIAIVILLMVSISTLIGLYTDYLWFDAIGFSQIFLISLFSKIKLFFIAAVIFFLFATINIWISSRFNEKKLIPFKIKLLIVTALSVLAGLIASSGWFKALQYLNLTQFNIQDPIFMKDVSFYVFSLPFYNLAWTFLIGCVIVTTILVLLDYLQSFIFGAKSVKKE